MIKLKKIIGIIVFIAVILNQILPIQYIRAKNNKTVNSIYNSFLSNKNLLWTHVETYTTNPYIKFRIEDLNLDGIPELLIYNDNASNADGQLAIYAYINKKVTYIESYPLWSVTFYRNKSGLIYSEILRDPPSGTYSIFNNKKIVPKYYWNSSYDYKNSKIKKSYFNVKNKELSERKLKKQLSKLKKNGNKLKISEGAENMYINNNKNRKKYLLSNN